MKERTICQVLAHWDAEAAVWVATSPDVKGLVATAEDEKALVRRLKAALPALMEANKSPVRYDAFMIDYIRRDVVEELEAA